MNNFLLFLKYNNNSDFCENYKNIFCFSNKRVVAVDESEYDKRKRMELQKLLGIRPYYLSQKVFKETLDYALSNPNEIVIRDIEFLDSAIEDTEEYYELMDMFLDNCLSEAYKQVYKILREFDTEIYELKIRFKNHDFTLVKTGVLESDAPPVIFDSFINDVKFNRLILGLS